MTQASVDSLSTGDLFSILLSRGATLIWSPVSLVAEVVNGTYVYSRETDDYFGSSMVQTNCFLFNCSPRAAIVEMSFTQIIMCSLFLSFVALACAWAMLSFLMYLRCLYVAYRDIVFWRKQMLPNVGVTSSDVPVVITEYRKIVVDDVFGYEYRDPVSGGLRRLMAPVLSPVVLNVTGGSLEPEMAFSGFEDRPKEAPASQVYFVGLTGEGEAKSWRVMGSGSRVGEEELLTVSHLVDDIKGFMAAGNQVGIVNNDRTSGVIPFKLEWDVVMESSKDELDVVSLAVPKTVFALLKTKVGKIAHFVPGTALLVYGVDAGVSKESIAIGHADPSRPYAIALKNNTKPGYSGAPVYNDRGLIVGVHLGALPSKKVNLATSLDFRLEIDARLRVESGILDLDTESAVGKKGHRARWNNDLDDDRELRREEHAKEADDEFEFGVRVKGTRYRLRQKGLMTEFTPLPDDTANVSRKSGGQSWADIEGEKALPALIRKEDFSGSLKGRDQRSTLERHPCSTSDGELRWALQEMTKQLTRLSQESQEQKVVTSSLLETVTRLGRECTILKESQKPCSSPAESSTSSTSIHGSREEAIPKELASSTKPIDSSTAKSRKKKKSKKSPKESLPSTPSPVAPSGRQEKA